MRSYRAGYLQIMIKLRLPVAMPRIFTRRKSIQHSPSSGSRRGILRDAHSRRCARRNTLLQNSRACRARDNARLERDARPLAGRREGGRADLRCPVHCPGHSPGSVGLFQRLSASRNVGDVLFAGSIRQADLPGGSHRELLRSIRGKFLPLGDDVAIISGHGRTSTIGRERANNPFLR